MPIENPSISPIPQALTDRLSNAEQGLVTTAGQVANLATRMTTAETSLSNIDAENDQAAIDINALESALATQIARIQALESANQPLRSATRPTTRSDGSALVSGDRWWHTSNLLWFVWDGARWVSEQLFLGRVSLETLSVAAQGLVLFSVDNRFDLWLDQFRVSARWGTTDSNNRWSFSVTRVNTSTEVVNVVSISSVPGANAASTLTQTINSFVSVGSTGPLSYFVTFARTGNPGSLTRLVAEVSYRLVGK